MLERRTDRWDILIVDDEPVVREAVRRVLEVEGYRVALAADARSALAHPACATCRLALCDLMLPDGSGLEVVRSLKAIRPDLPIIVITGYPTSDNADAARVAGASEFLPKPFTESELLDATRRVVKRRES